MFFLSAEKVEPDLLQPQLKALFVDVSPYDTQANMSVHGHVSSDKQPITLTEYLIKLQKHFSFTLDSFKP